MKSILMIMAAIMLATATAHADLDMEVFRKNVAAKQAVKVAAKKAQAKADAAAANADVIARIGGPGWYRTIETYEKWEAAISGHQEIAKLRRAFQSRSGLDVTSALKTMEAMYPGSSVNYAGNGKIFDGTDTITLRNLQVLQLDRSADELGLITHLTFPSRDNIATLTLTDNQSLIKIKIDTVNPRKSRLVDANLPTATTQGFTSTFNQLGVTTNEKTTMLMLEGFYLDELQPQGIALQDMAVGVITEIDWRVRFSHYAERKASEKHALPVDSHPKVEVGIE